MADSDVTGTLGTSGADVIVDVRIGDGLIGFWIVALMDGSTLVRRFEGRSDDALPDQVRLPASALKPDGSALSWSVMLFPSTRKAPYHVAVDVTQDGKSLLKRVVRLSGQLEPRKNHTLSGTIHFQAP